MKEIDTKEILISTTKSLFGAVPFAGTALNELFFEYNGKIKQKRLNNFIEILAEYFSNNADVNIDNIKTEDFNDLFESVLKRVVTTKSTLKLNRFRDILITELNYPTEQNEVIDIYLDLITVLSEEELNILNHHRPFDKTYNEEFKHLEKIRHQLHQMTESKNRETAIIAIDKDEKKILSLKIEIENLKNKHNLIEKFRTNEYYKMEEQKFFFYKQRLQSKGLLYDDGMGRFDIRPFQRMNITEFGIEFIDFIIKNTK